MHRHLGTLLNGAVLGLIIGVLAALALTTHSQQAAHVDPSPTSNLPVHGHGCWSGEAPADMEGKVPGGVVVTLHPGETPAYLHTPKAVGAALDHVFSGLHPEMTVWSFCRGDQTP